MKIKMDTSKITLKTLLLCLFTLSIIAIPQTQTGTAYAGDIADSPCDIDGYFKTLKARAWLEAQREITQNQNLIYKPDSVLEYTCFGEFIQVLTAQSGIYDTNSPHYMRLEQLLDNMVGHPVATYLKINFSEKLPVKSDDVYPLLGGHAESLDYQIYYDGNSLRPLKPGAYNCGIMNEIWKEAKCTDIVNPEFENGFYTFSNYRDNPDKRQIPNECVGPGDIWGAKMEMASDPLAIDSSTEVPPWHRDNIETYFELTNKIDCSKSKAIPTGILVSPSGKDAYDEKICIKPGCNYSPKSGKCKN